MQTQQYISVIWIYISFLSKQNISKVEEKLKPKHRFFFFIFVPEGWSCYTHLTCKCDRKIMMTCDLCLVEYTCLIFAGSTPAKVYGKLRAIQSSASRIWINWSVYIYDLFCLCTCMLSQGVPLNGWVYIFKLISDLKCNLKLWKVVVVQCYKIKKDSQYTHIL